MNPRKAAWQLAFAMALFLLAVPAPAPAVGAQQSLGSLVAESRARLRAYDYQAALQAAQRAVARSPLDLAANAALRNAHGELGTLDDLVLYYQRLLQQYPDAPAASYLLSTAFRDREMSRAFLLEALRLDPQFAPAVRELAHLKAIGTEADMLEWTRRALDLMPADYRAARAHVMALQRSNRRDAAIEFLRSMTAQHPNVLELWVELWRAELNAMDRSRRSIGPLLGEINAQRFRFLGSMENMEMLAQALRSGGDDGREYAADLWLEIADRYPDHPRSQLALLNAASATQRGSRRLEILELLLERYPDSPAVYRAYERMIQQLNNQKQYDAAIDLSRSIIDMPDAGYVFEGIGRDSAVRNDNWGMSLACIGHVGWYTAAWMKATEGMPNRVVPAPFRGYSARSRALAIVEALTPIVSPEAAAAGQSLLRSSCRERGALLSVGMYLAGHPSYRPLGIELLKLATSVPPGPGARTDSDSIRRQAEELVEVNGFLVDVYLADGRVEEAVDLAVELSRTKGTGWSADTEAIVARAYAAAGRVDEAKAGFLRSLSSRQHSEWRAEELARLYRETSDTTLQRFEAERASRISPRAIQVRRPDLGVNAPLSRYLTEPLTLVYVWTPTFEPSRAHVDALHRLGTELAESGVATLLIGVSRSATGAARAHEADPTAGSALVAGLELLAPLTVTELPTTLLIDREGRILARQMSFEVPPGAWLEGWKAVIGEELARLRNRAATDAQPKPASRGRLSPGARQR